MSNDRPRIVRVPAPVREQVVDILRDEILHGRFAPGQRLIERELCDELSIGRNTLREAYRQLEAEGWITMIPHRGPSVAVMSEKEARELYEVREALECLAVKLFVERADDSALRQLGRAATELRNAHKSGVVPDMLDAKQRFYDELYQGAGNELLRAQAALLQNRLFVMRQRSLAIPGRAKESLAEIARVMERVRKRDAIGAAASWGEHIHHAADAALTAYHVNDPNQSNQSA